MGAPLRNNSLILATGASLWLPLWVTLAFLFDTNALSEAFRRRPNPAFTQWLGELPAARQFTSSVVVAELYVAAYRARGSEKWLRRTNVRHFDRIPGLRLLTFQPGEDGEFHAP